MRRRRLQRMGTPVAIAAALAPPMNINHIGNVNDLDVTAALNAFVRNAMPDGVAVEFAGGVASLSGCVSSPKSSRAIEDLILAHEGVLSVVNNLVVEPRVAARTHSRD